MTTIGQDLTDVPFPDLIRSMATSIAEAQYAVDTISLKIAQLMAGSKYNEKNGTYENDDTTRVQFGAEKLSLLELGFTPTFYQFVDTIIEVKMSISMSTSTDSTLTSSQSQQQSSFAGGIDWRGIHGSVAVKSASVNAVYASKYQYSAEGASLLRTKLVPVPPPAVLQERIRAMMVLPPAQIAGATPPPTPTPTPTAGPRP
jgi:hypothetical protein